MWKKQSFSAATWMRRPSSLIGRIVLALVVAVQVARPVTAGPIKQATDAFTAGGKRIQVERFEPKAKGKYPAVLLLHASFGLKNWGPFYRLAARKLAARGYVALVVHYFDRTGTVHIQPKQIKPQQFRLWLDTVRQAVAHTARQGNVDRRHIGLVGFSLGAYLALAAGSQGDLPIAAVVELFGDLPAELRKGIKRLPHLLMVHGGRDRTVPVSTVRSLEQTFRARRLKYEIKIYPQQDHLFLTDLFGRDVQDAQRLTLAFLDKHLK
jgi:dienelactone hydrolase